MFLYFLSRRTRVLPWYYWTTLLVCVLADDGSLSHSIVYLVSRTLTMTSSSSLSLHTWYRVTRPKVLLPLEPTSRSSFWHQNYRHPPPSGDRNKSPHPLQTSDLFPTYTPVIYPTHLICVRSLLFPISQLVNLHTGTRSPITPLTYSRDHRILLSYLFSLPTSDSSITPSGLRHLSFLNTSIGEITRCYCQCSLSFSYWTLVTKFTTETLNRWYPV